MRGSLVAAAQPHVKHRFDELDMKGAEAARLSSPPMAATPSPSTTSLGQLLDERASAADIERHLDALAPAARLEQVLAVTGRGVRRLYEAVEGGAVPTLDELVPAGTEGVVIFEGRNSLAAFSRFQKRFVRKGGLVLGYNHQTMSFVTGPGYFVVHPPSGAGEHGKELDFDYTTPPPAEPEGWPTYRPNERGLSRFVYGHMHDFVRRVARGVVVGKAYRRGKEQDAYFSLTLPS
jgi:hypothetical protein